MYDIKKKTKTIPTEVKLTFYIFHATKLYPQRSNTNLLYCIIYLLLSSLTCFILHFISHLQGDFYNVCSICFNLNITVFTHD